jgi:hypothetical protein
MGDNSTPNKLLWFHTDSGSNIVIDKSKTTVNVRINATASSDPGDVDPPPALLSAIVVLTHEDFRLSSDGYWKEPVDTAPALADVILSCTGAAPIHDTLHDDFNTVLRNISSLISRVHTPTHIKKSFVIDSAINLQPKISFNHSLFFVMVSP